MRQADMIHAFLSESFPAPSKDWARRILADPHATYIQKRLANEALLPRIGRHEKQPVEEDDGQPF